MTTIDNRKVEMEFDNKRFEENANDTIKTLEKLKKGLQFDNSTKGLDDIEKKAGKFDLSGIQNAIDSVNQHFSAFGIFAITLFQNIAQSAINAGKTIISALTIDPIKTGFQEYETQINAIQTILANTESKGTTLKDVTEALDTLNTYADKTIYNFTEMTRNIGTFTAAGIDLKTATTAIQGIANLAAVSGSTSQQASVAMYQLSQALASGTVKLMDWNSVVNAGMGGQVFQDALKETARVHGIAIDDMIKKEGSFRETLQKGWLTSEILTETLEKFTLTTEGLTEAEIQRNREMLKNKGYTDEQIDAIFKLGATATDAATKVKTFTQLWDTLKEAAQSGWTQSWEYIIGDFDEAKESLTAISNYFNDVIGSSAEARNSMLKFWHDNGGRDAAIEAIKNAFQALLSVITPIKEAFRDVFPPTTGQQLLDITNKIKDFTATLKLSEPQMENLKNTFRGLFSILDIGVELFKAIGKAILPLFGGLTTLGDGILSVTGTFGDFIYNLDQVIKKNDVFYKAIKSVVDFIISIPNKIENLTGIDFGKVFDNALESVKNFVNSVSDALKEFKNIDTSGLDSFGEKVEERFKPFKFIGDGFVSALSAIGWIAQKTFPVLYSLAQSVGKAFGDLFDGIGDALERGDFESIFDIINGSIFATILLKLKDFVSSLDDVKGIGENISGILDSVRGSLESFQQNLKAKTLLTISTAIGILAASLLVLSTIDSQKMTSSLTAITSLFIELFTFMGGLSKLMTVNNLTGIAKIATGMVAISAAILILSAALKSLSKLDWEGLAKGLLGTTALLAEMAVVANTLSKGKQKFIKGASGLILMATAIVILTNAVKSLSELKWEELAKGLTGTMVLLAMLVEFINHTNFKGAAGIGKGTGLVLLAASITILVNAVESISTLKWEELAKGLAGVGALLLELSIFTKLTSGSTKMITTATGMTILAAAMLIFADSIKKLGDLTWNEIGKGLLSIAAGLTVMTAALKLMPWNSLTKSVGLVILASSIEILVDALNKTTKMSWEQVAKGFIAIGGALVILAVALKAMKGTLVGSAALLVAATALNALAIPLKVLGKMSLESICKSLIAMAGAFAVLGVSASILSPLIPAILGLSGALALLGVGLLGIGAGVLAFSAGMSALAVAGTAGAAALVASLAMIAGFIPELIRTLGDALKAILEVVIEVAPTFGQAVLALIVTLCDVLVQGAPKIVETALTLLEELLSSLVAHAPDLFQLGAEFILELIAGITEYGPMLVEAGINMIITLLNSLADTMYERADEIADALYNVVLAAIYILATLAHKMWETVVGLMKEVIKGIWEKRGEIKENLKDAILNAIEAISTLLNNMYNKVVELITSGLKAAKDKLHEWWQAGKSAAVEFLTGYKSVSMLTVVNDGMNEILYSISGKSGAAQEIGRKIGVNVGNGVSTGMDQARSNVIASSNQIINIIDKVLRKKGMIHSPSRLTAKIGNYLGQGIAVGIESAYDEISKASEGAIDLFGNLRMPQEYTPTISPVMDLSNIDNGTQYISEAFNKEKLGFSDISNTYANNAAIQMGSYYSDNKAVVDEISNLRSDVNQLNSAIKSMQVVMDSGALVGSIAQPMDEALGQISSYKGRGI